jgi:hypothetical protein
LAWFSGFIFLIANKILHPEEIEDICQTFNHIF